jgi:hypothetical protein
MMEIERQYWLWETRPEYYLDEDGSERESLDPENSTDSDGWWTCNKGTKEGDLVFLWRTSPKKDIGYLIQPKATPIRLPMKTTRDETMHATIRFFTNLTALFT